MKRLIENYTFNAATRQIIIIDGENITQEKLLLITNMTDGVIVYNFADSDTRGSISRNVITLNYDTSAMSNEDTLQIWVEDTNPLMVMLCTCINVIKHNISKLTFDVSGQLRTAVSGAVTIASGTVTTVSALTTMSTGNMGIGDNGKAATSILKSTEAFHNTIGKNFTRS